MKLFNNNKSVATRIHKCKEVKLKLLPSGTCLLWESFSLKNYLLAFPLGTFYNLFSRHSKCPFSAVRNI